MLADTAISIDVAINGAVVENLPGNASQRVKHVQTQAQQCFQILVFTIPSAQLSAVTGRERECLVATLKITGSTSGFQAISLYTN